MVSFLFRQIVKFDFMLGLYLLFFKALSQSSSTAPMHKDTQRSLLSLSLPVANSDLAYGMKLVCHASVYRMQHKCIRKPPLRLQPKTQTPAQNITQFYHKQFFMQPGWAVYICPSKSTLHLSPGRLTSRVLHQPGSQHPWLPRVFVQSGALAGCERGQMENVFEICPP